MSGGNCTVTSAPLLITGRTTSYVYKTLLISKVSFRCEEIEVQVQEMTCSRSGIEKAPLMTVFALSSVGSESLKSEEGCGVGAVGPYIAKQCVFLCVC